MKKHTAEPSPDDLLTTVEVGKLLGTSRFTIGRLLRGQPELGERIGGAGANSLWYVRRRDIGKVRRAMEG